MARFSRSVHSTTSPTPLSSIRKPSQLDAPSLLAKQRKLQDYLRALAALAAAPPPSEAAAPAEAETLTRHDVELEALVAAFLAPRPLLHTTFAGQGASWSG